MMGVHKFLGVPWTGYEGKEFIQSGYKLAVERTAAELPVRIGAAMQEVGRVKRIRMKQRRNGPVNFNIKLVENMSTTTKAVQKKYRSAIVTSLTMAGRDFRREARKVYRQKTRRTRQSELPTTITPRSDDTRDIPSNLGFRIHTEGNVYVLEMGAMEYSIKLFRQEFGQSGSGFFS